MFNNREIDTIIAKLAHEHGISTDEVEKAIRTQFKFVKETMEQGELDSVHLHYFGKFCTKPNRVKQLIENGYKVKTKV